MGKFLLEPFVASGGLDPPDGAVSSPEEEPPLDEFLFEVRKSVVCISKLLVEPRTQACADM